ncbi:hypothetical protein [Streptomyces sp. NPDC058086]|uniref:bestrophin-like domain n=1 Tax=Streptomyces sp. NPDC058086 TaxID=3346334 RepID=UPI0036E1A8A7
MDHRATFAHDECLAERKANNDAVGFVYAQVGVIYAVVLAMVVVGVWDARSRAHENTYTETNALLQITWFSRTLPQPDRGRLGTLTEQYTRTAMYDEWPLLGEQRDDPAAWRQFTEIRQIINTQEPESAESEPDGVPAGTGPDTGTRIAVRPSSGWLDSRTAVVTPPWPAAPSALPLPSVRS